MARARASRLALSHCPTSRPNVPRGRRSICSSSSVSAAVNVGAGRPDPTAQDALGFADATCARAPTERRRLLSWLSSAGARAKPLPSLAAFVSVPARGAAAAARADLSCERGTEEDPGRGGRARTLALHPQWSVNGRLGSLLPHLRRDWAHPCHICAGTGLTPATSAPGLGSPLSSPAGVRLEDGPVPLHQRVRRRRLLYRARLPEAVLEPRHVQSPPCVLRSWELYT